MAIALSLIANLLSPLNQAVEWLSGASANADDAQAKTAHPAGQARDPGQLEAGATHGVAADAGDKRINSDGAGAGAGAGARTGTGPATDTATDRHSSTHAGEASGDVSASGASADADAAAPTGRSRPARTWRGPLRAPSQRRKLAQDGPSPALAGAAPGLSNVDGIRSVRAEGKVRGAAISRSGAAGRVAGVRVIRAVEGAAACAQAGRMVISGRLADVCAELDRLAALELAH